MYGGTYYGQTYFSGLQSSYPIIVNSINGGGWSTAYWGQTYWAQHTGFFGSTIYTLLLSDTLQILDRGILKAITLNKIDTVALSDNIKKTIQAIKSDSIAFSDNISKTLNKVISDTISFIDSVQKSGAKIFSDTISFPDSLQKNTSRTLTDALNITDKDPDQTNNEWAGYYWGGYIWARGNIQYGKGYITIDKRKIKDFTETITLTDIFSLIKTKFISFTDSFSLADIFNKYIIKNLIDAISVSDLPYDVINAAWATGYWGSYIWSRGTIITRRFFFMVKSQYRTLSDTLSFIDRLTIRLNGAVARWRKVLKTTAIYTKQLKTTAIYTKVAKAIATFSKVAKPTATFSKQVKPTSIWRKEDKPEM